MSVILAACANAPQKITVNEQEGLKNPSREILDKVDSVFQERLKNQRALEAYILANGRTLNRRETALAHKIGIKHLNRIRLLEMDYIPRHDTLRKIKEGKHLKKPPFRLAFIGGFQAGYGLAIDKEYINEDWLLAHELAHVYQFEKLGQEAMLRRVLTEHQILDGKLIPIEREAIELSEKVTGIKAPGYYN